MFKLQTSAFCRIYYFRYYIQDLLLAFYVRSLAYVYLFHACDVHANYAIATSIWDLVLMPIPNSGFFDKCFCEQEYSREVADLFREET